VVFADRCPHRLVPLSAGTVDGGVLQCRYHGWQFDETGQSVAVPSNGSDGNIPPCADLPPGPAAREDDGAVWVRRTDVHEPVPLDLLSNVDPGLARAWHPVALLDELPATARLLDRDYSLTVAEGSVLAEPAPFAVTVRWGLVWLAPLEPLTGLFDDPDAEDAAYVGACGVPKPWLLGLTWALRGAFVFVDQPAEEGAAFDPLVGQVADGTVGSWGLQLRGPMRTVAVVVTRVFVECSAEVSFAEDEHAVGHLGAGGEHEPFRIRVGPRGCAVGSCIR
jgi:nitrite reductase/ring-hydroxylating ferredoxin subunit